MDPPAAELSGHTDGPVDRSLALDKQASVVFPPRAQSTWKQSRRLHCTKSHKVLRGPASSQRDFPGGAGGKEPACQRRRHRDAGSIPGSGRSPGGGHASPLPYSCLENPMDRGAWRAALQGVAQSRTTGVKKESVHCIFRGPGYLRMSAKLRCRTGTHGVL